METWRIVLTAVVSVLGVVFTMLGIFYNMAKDVIKSVKEEISKMEGNYEKEELGNIKMPECTKCREEIDKQIISIERDVQGHRISIDLSIRAIHEEITHQFLELNKRMDTFSENINSRIDKLVMAQNKRKIYCYHCEQWVDVMDLGNIWKCPNCGNIITLPAKG